MLCVLLLWSRSIQGFCADSVGPVGGRRDWFRGLVKLGVSWLGGPLEFKKLNVVLMITISCLLLGCLLKPGIKCDLNC